MTNRKDSTQKPSETSGGYMAVDRDEAHKKNWSLIRAIISRFYKSSERSPSTDNDTLKTSNLSEANRVIEKLKLEIENLNIKLETTDDLLLNVIEDRELLEADLKRAELFAGTLIKIKRELTEENEKLTETIEAMRGTPGDYAETVTQLNTLKAEHEQLKVGLETLTAENKKLEDAIVAHSKLSYDTQKKISDLLKSEHVKSDTLAKQNEIYKARITTLEERLSHLIIEVDKAHMYDREVCEDTLNWARKALADAETFTTDVDNEKPELTKPSKE